MTSTIRCSRVLTLLMCLVPSVLGQDRGSLRGTVTDQSNAAVPEASVTARNTETNLTQTVNTIGDGTFTILYLPVGNYNVTVEKREFKKYEISNVTVDVNSVVPVNVSLSVGAVNQSVEVTAAAPLLEVTGANLGKVVPTRAIMDLPLSIGGGIRSNMSFVILTPGVIGSSGNPRIGGGMLDGQSEQLDGAESQSERRNDPAMNGISVEGVEEFKVQSSSYSAEYGRTSDGVINWATKSEPTSCMEIGLRSALTSFSMPAVIRLRPPRGGQQAMEQRRNHRWSGLHSTRVRRPQQSLFLFCLRSGMTRELAAPRAW